MAKGTYIEADILESQAYLSLSGIASKVLFWFMLKRQFEKVGGKKNKKQKSVCVNSDSLSLTYIEAKDKYGITQPRLTRAIDELLEKGFLTCTYRGGAWIKDKSKYGVIDKYLLWKPGTVFEVRQKDPVTRGFCRPKKDAEKKN